MCDNSTQCAFLSMTWVRNAHCTASMFKESTNNVESIALLNMEIKCWTSAPTSLMKANQCGHEGTKVESMYVSAVCFRSQLQWQREMTGSRDERWRWDTWLWYSICTFCYVVQNSAFSSGISRKWMTGFHDYMSQWHHTAFKINLHNVRGNKRRMWQGMRLQYIVCS